MPHPAHHLAAFWRDLRHAGRVLRRSPLFALTAVVTLAVGIGANAAVLQLVDALLLRSLPYPHADELSLVSRALRSDTFEQEGWSQTGRTWQVLDEHAETVELAPFSDWATGANLAVGDGAVYVREQRVGAGLFGVLGVAPALGREIAREEDVPGGPRVVVLSHGLWQGAFGGDPGVVGRTVSLKGEPHTVVGVMPRGFRSTTAADLWTPLRPSTTGEGEGTNYGIVTRRLGDVSPERAEAEIAALGERIWEEESRAWGSDVEARFGLLPLQAGLTGNLRRPLVLLWAAVALVLLVVCANLASLMLARTTGRRREMAARMALGGGRGTAVRSILAESLLVTTAGAAGGLVLGYLAVDLLSGLARDALGIWQPLALDGRVVGLTAGLALLACLAFGLAPAVAASRFDLRAALSQGGAGSASAGATRWPRRLLVVGEVAVGVLLAVFAVLLARSFLHLEGLDSGVDPDGVVTATVSLHDARYAERADVERLFGASLERLRATPGIEAAAVGLGLPFERPLNLGFTALPPGAPPTEPAAISATYVTPGYFAALGVPRLAGRELGTRDAADALPVAVVNRAFVERYLGGAEPLASRVAIAGGERQIVGVVGDVLHDPAGLGGSAPLERPPMVYLPAAQIADEMFALVHTWFEPSWVVRGELGEEALGAAVRQAMAEVAPTLPFASSRTLREVEARALARERLLMVLVVALAAVATFLAGLGVYGLMAHTVAERTRELGIRLALGATPGQVLRAVVLPGIALGAVGTLVGIAGAVGGARLLEHLVWGVATTDVASYAAAAGALLVLSAAASFLPGLRVLGLDPARTLREE